MYIPPMESIARFLRNNSMGELEFFAQQIAQWKDSPERRDQLTGERYYHGDHDILRRARQVFDSGGRPNMLRNLPNNKVVDNLYAQMVDQKSGYLLGRPFSVDGEDEAFKAALNGVFDAGFRRMLRHVLEDALNGGIAWLFPYYGEDGRLRFRHFPAYEILPFWADDEHERLDCAARLYEVESWEGAERKVLEKVEIFKPDGIYRYRLEERGLAPDPDANELHSPYITVRRAADGGTPTEEPYNWEKIPLVAFRYNKTESPLITRCKTLQDTINLMHSDFANSMQKSILGSVLVLKGYGDEPLENLWPNIASFNAIKVEDSPNGMGGGVDVLDVKFDAANFEVILKLLKRSMIENARGFDAKDDRVGGNPNQMNIQSMYSAIDLDASITGTEFKAAMKELLWFICAYFSSAGKGTFPPDGCEIIFNTDILVNESQVIEDCRKSLGLISRQTIVAQHPWVADVAAEMERIEEEEWTPDNYCLAHGQALPGGALNAEEQ